MPPDGARAESSESERGGHDKTVALRPRSRQAVLAALRGCGAGVIDIHTHSGADWANFSVPRYPALQNLGDLVRRAAANRVDALATMPMPAFEYRPAVRKSDGTEDFPYRAANRYLLYEAELFQHSELAILPFLAVHPGERVREQLQALERAARQESLYGLKLHTLATGTNARELIGSPLVEFAIRNDLPITIHSGTDKFPHTRPRHALELAEAHPALRVCIAHLGNFDSVALARAREMPNVFLDTAPFLVLCRLAQVSDEWMLSRNHQALPFDKPLHVLRELCEMLPGRLIWGSDEPWSIATGSRGAVLERSSYEAERALIDQLPEPQYQQLAYHSALAYLGAGTV
jgi:predicted TIM-barrel fold metal-dependent hydrolase